MESALYRKLASLGRQPAAQGRQVSHCGKRADDEGHWS
jgi:hypothetical protein